MSVAIKQGTKEEYQLHLEQLYDKHQLMPRVRSFFKEYKKIPFTAAMEELGIPVDFGVDAMAQVAVHKRANVSTMVGCLRRHCETAQQVADLLEKMVRGKFMMYEDGVFIVYYDIPDALQGELDKFQYPLPMVVEPLPLEDNLSTGYYTQRGSVILRDNYHEEDVCLDHLNRMNRIRFSINEDVAKTIQNKWANLDKKKEDESFEDYRKRKKAFEKYCTVADTVIGKMVEAGNEFYITHRVDKRGRTYCQGHHINPQGTDWNKAVLELADRECIEL